MKKHNFVKISSNICLTGNIQLILMSVIIYVNIQKFVDLWIFIYHISIESFEGNFQLIFFSLTSAFLKLLKENYFSRILSLIFFFEFHSSHFFNLKFHPPKFTHIVIKIFFTYSTKKICSCHSVTFFSRLDFFQIFSYQHSLMPSCLLLVHDLGSDFYRNTKALK